MDLSSPISSVIPSVHGVVLAVLARTDAPLSGRGVAALTGGRAGQWRVNQVLGELTEAGIVTREEHPPAYLYRLNRAHLAAAPITALASLRATLIASMQAAVEAWPRPAAAVWLFGSAARGDGGPASDIDVLVLRPDDVSEEDPEWVAQVDGLSADVTAWTGNSCALLEYSEAEFAALVARGQRLVDELRSDALWIAGDQVGDRCRRAKAS